MVCCWCGWMVHLGWNGHFSCGMAWHHETSTPLVVLCAIPARISLRACLFWKKRKARLPPPPPTHTTLPCHFCTLPASCSPAALLPVASRAIPSATSPGEHFLRFACSLGAAGVRAPGISTGSAVLWRRNINAAGHGGDVAWHMAGGQMALAAEK